MIKKIDKIPETKTGRESRRAKLRADIEQAWNEGISKFEFIGYDGWKYIAQYAREEATFFFEKLIRPLYKKLFSDLYGEEYAIPRYQAEKDLFTITSKKIDGEVHCYCELFHMGEEFEAFIEDMVKKDKERRGKQNQKARNKK